MVIIIIIIFRKQSTVIHTPLTFPLQISVWDSEMGTAVVHHHHIAQTTPMLANHRPLHHTLSTTWISVDCRTQQWVGASSTDIQVQHTGK